ncbi:hypothetical protein E2C01_090720 [Portunus trituberculatus]|uniref:Uncharacterized protein n=1 Tax=Portunus trituberculatus TaxID=210409 RepID=A0A5B7JT65_PORTR|nr:hypothetical protein [Portunus trituberculatus]
MMTLNSLPSARKSADVAVRQDRDGGGVISKPQIGKLKLIQTVDMDIEQLIGEMYLTSRIRDASSKKQ